MLPKTVMIAGGILLLLIAGLVIPTDFDMRAKGTLQPVSKRDVFAATSGEVIEVYKDNGDAVAAGEVLAVMRNPELDIKLAQVQGEYEGALKQKNAFLAQINSSAVPLSAAERMKLETEVAVLNKRTLSLRKQLELLREQKEKLTIKAPIPGQVITWDAKRLLQNRPVETGQVLMTIAAADTNYEVELFMPERRIEHLRRARDKVKQADPSADLAVDFIAMMDPGVNHHGKIVHVNPTAEPHEEHGNMVRIRVQPDQPLTHARPGATVTADVHCGRAPFLWAKLHEAWEWVEANLLF
jgi:multidrug efflux pump subunit AcrA (membrane-fusion protein)